MTNVISESTITVDGHAFRMRVIQDEHAGAPWDNSDGHGPVRMATYKDRYDTHPSKRAGERPLNSPRYGDALWLYDWRAAIALALKDGWGVGEGKRPEETARQYAERAVQRDFDYLARWVRNDWCYVGVEVTHTASDSGTALWGIESTETAYHDTVARELAAEVMTLPGFIAWRERITARERALILAPQMLRLADMTRPATTVSVLREAAALLETLARGAE